MLSRFSYADAPRGLARQAVRSGLLLIAMLTVLFVCAFAIAAWTGVVIVSVAAVGSLALAPHLSPATIMRRRGAAAARPLQLTDVRQRLAHVASLPRAPGLFLQRGFGINAFAAGDRERPAVAVSEGALRYLAPGELDAVFAHEIAHLAAGDAGLLLVAATIRRITASVALFGLIASGVGLAFAGVPVAPLWAVFLFAAAPSATALLTMALARDREFAADAAAARIVGSPITLAAALDRVRNQTQGPWRWFIGPTAGSRLPNLLRTHPSIDERIARLLER